MRSDVPWLLPRSVQVSKIFQTFLYPIPVLRRQVEAVRFRIKEDTDIAFPGREARRERGQGGLRGEEAQIPDSERFFTSNHASFMTYVQESRDAGRRVAGAEAIGFVVVAAVALGSHFNCSQFLERQAESPGFEAELDCEVWKECEFGKRAAPWHGIWLLRSVWERRFDWIGERW